MVPVISESASIVAASDVLASEFDDELVLLDLRDGVYYGLEHVGARVWALVQQPIAVRAIGEAIVTEYDVDPARCAHDLHALLTELAAKGLVEVCI